MATSNRLGTEPIGKLIVALALPAVMAQLINVLYNMVDRIYIGRIPEVGAVALTGLGLAFPIIMLVSAFSSFAGAGGAPLMAIELGRGNQNKAEKILGNAAVLLLFFSLTLTILFQIFKEPMLYLFGASSDTIVYSLQYLEIYLLGTIFVQLSLGLNMFISSQGQAKIAMCSVMIGAVLNMILDPIFIFGFNMGVRGAALATIVAQSVSAFWVVSFLRSERSAARLQRKHMVPDPKIILFIAALGVSPFIMQSTESLVSIVFNSGLQRYGNDLYVGSMVILQSVMQLIVVPVQGITQGTQSIISFNYGANQLQRVKKTFTIVASIALTITTLGTIAACFAPRFFAMIFTDDAALIALVTRVLPIFVGGMWMFGLQMSCQSTFIGLGRAKISLFLALLRKIILLVPLALFLPTHFGVESIYYAEPIADITAATVTCALFFFTFRKLMRDSQQNASAQP